MSARNPIIFIYLYERNPNMKKKFLAGILSLLMICTMVPGVFAGGVSHSDSAVVTTTDGSVKVLSSNFMYEECPECDYGAAIYYVLDGDVKFFCPDCRKAGYIIDSHNSCYCGKNCDCAIKCPDCGRTGSCGERCSKCSTFLKCAIDCESCFDTKVSCICGKDCGCTVKCPDCGRTGNCGEYCTRCGDYLKCTYNCEKCWAYTYDCICGKDCDCTVKCPDCGRTGSCGEYCSKCGDYLKCADNCKGCCSVDIYDPCVCGTSCLCRVQCYNCMNVGACGYDCHFCKTPLSCRDYCSSCSDKRNEYKVIIKQNAGGEYAITGGAFGSYGEVKTLTIEPYAGYAISDVIINGKSYGADYNKFQIKMIRNYTVQITFVKLAVSKQYTVTSTVTGNGRLTLVKNGESIKDNASVKAAYGDTLVYRFFPAGDNYYIKDVKVNGRSVGPVTIHTLTKITGNTKIAVEFAWDCPYSDVEAAHLKAVEYVTEAGIMSSLYTQIGTDLFKGTNRVSVKSFVAALAEMADTDDKLNSTSDRVDWAIKKNLITKDQDQARIVNVQRAASIIAKFLDVLEAEHDITFTGNDASYTAKQVCDALNLISEAAYNQNASVSRYDLAELCYAISQLEYKD